MRRHFPLAHPRPALCSPPEGTLGRAQTPGPAVGPGLARAPATREVSGSIVAPLVTARNLLGGRRGKPFAAPPGPTAGVVDRRRRKARSSRGGAGPARRVGLRRGRAPAQPWSACPRAPACGASVGSPGLRAEGDLEGRRCGCVRPGRGGCRAPPPPSRCSSRAGLGAVLHGTSRWGTRAVLGARRPVPDAAGS